MERTLILLYFKLHFYFLDIGAFVLNFNGRVDKPSVKNFQLIDEYDGFEKF